MQNLNLNYLSESQSVYIFYQCKLKKTWCKVKGPLNPLKLCTFLEEKKLCVCSTLSTYIAKRESWGTHESQVLLSFVKPHKVVTSSTVSR